MPNASLGGGNLIVQILSNLNGFRWADNESDSMLSCKKKNKHLSQRACWQGICWKKITQNQIDYVTSETLHSLNSMHPSVLYIRWLNEMQQLLVCCFVSMMILNNGHHQTRKFTIIIYPYHLKTWTKYLQDSAPRAFVRAVRSGSDLKLDKRGSKPLASMTNCWLVGLFWTTVVTTSAAFARIPALEFLRYLITGTNPPTACRSRTRAKIK